MTARQAMQLRFHLDESVNHAVARGLRQRGIEATTTTDAGLTGETDKAQLEYAVCNGATLVTHDRDFLRIVAATGDHPGVAYCPPGRRTIGQIVLRLVHLWRTTSADEMRGRTEFL
ncbi:MAG: DUF5615 family PIN-like protein [Pirellulaceae bacterium]